MNERQNDHTIRKQKDVELPTRCKPNYSFSCPEKFGGEHCGRQIPDNVLINVGDSFGIEIPHEPVMIASELKEMILEIPTSISDAAAVFESLKKELNSMAAGQFLTSKNIFSACSKVRNPQSWVSLRSMHGWILLLLLLSRN